jgi:hypothetical protein
MKSTAASRRKADLLVRLIATFRDGVEVNVPFICSFSGYSCSGARKLLKQLGQDGVLDLAEVPRFQNKVTVGFLSPDRAHVQQYVLDLQAFVAGGPLEALPYKYSGRYKVPPAERNIHLAPDDEPFRVKFPALIIPAPDPVLAALFGMRSAT